MGGLLSNRLTAAVQVTDLFQFSACLCFNSDSATGPEAIKASCDLALLITISAPMKPEVHVRTTGCCALNGGAITRRATTNIEHDNCEVTLQMSHTPSCSSK
jgi:hypothetical protein